MSSVEQHELFYRPKYIKIHEVVHPNTYREYEKIGRLDRLWWIFDPRLLWTADRLRELYGPIIINTWYKAKAGGGYTINNAGFKERGLRDLTTDTGAALSQHKFGRAIDCHFTSITSPTIIDRIEAAGMFKTGKWRQDTSNPLFNALKYVTCMERSIGGKRISWFHFDVGNRPLTNDAIIVLNL